MVERRMRKRDQYTLQPIRIPFNSMWFRWQRESTKSTWEGQPGAVHLTDAGAHSCLYNTTAQTKLRIKLEEPTE